MTYTDIINGIVKLVIAVLVGFVIPYIKTQKDVGKAKKETEAAKKLSTEFDTYTSMADRAVGAARQLFDSNDQRRNYVVTTLEALGVPHNTVEMLLESGVDACKIAQATIDAAKQVETAADTAINATNA